MSIDISFTVSAEASHPLQSSSIQSADILVIYVIVSTAGCTFHINSSWEKREIIFFIFKMINYSDSNTGNDVMKEVTEKV